MTESSRDPLPLASAVRKARRASTLACGHTVNVGHVIAKRAGRWVCVECAVAGVRAASQAKAAAR